MLNEISQLHRDKYERIPPLVGTWSSQIQKHRKQNRDLPGTGGRRKWGLLVHRNPPSGRDDGKILEMDGGDGCPTL